MSVQLSLRSSSLASSRGPALVFFLMVALTLFGEPGINRAVAAKRGDRAETRAAASSRPTLLGLWDDRDTGGIQGLRGGVGTVRMLFRPRSFELTSLYRTRYGVQESQAAKTMTGKYRVEGNQIILEIRRCTLLTRNSAAPVARAPCDDMWRPANVSLRLDGTRLLLRGRPLAGFTPARTDETTTLSRVPSPAVR